MVRNCTIFNQLNCRSNCTCEVVKLENSNNCIIPFLENTTIANHVIGQYLQFWHLIIISNLQWCLTNCEVQIVAMYRHSKIQESRVRIRGASCSLPEVSIINNSNFGTLFAPQFTDFAPSIHTTFANFCLFKSMIQIHWIMYSNWRKLFIRTKYIVFFKFSLILSSGL